MSVENRLKRIEEKLSIGCNMNPMVLVIGRKGGRKVDEAELERRIEEAIRWEPGAEFILLT